MIGKEFLAADNITGANNSPREIRQATQAVAAYAYRMTDTTPAAVDLAAELVDELGLNGRPMRTSRHYRKNSPKGIGDL